MTRQVLNYFDVQLYDSDVALFAAAQWLNDNAINFYFQHLYRSLCVAPSPSSTQDADAAASDVLFVDPAVVSCLLFQCDDDDEFAELGAGLGVRHKQLCFIPVNDNEELGGESTHWSLLVYRRAMHRFEHFDSSAGHNTRAAKRIAHAFEKLLRLSASSATSPSPSSSASLPVHHAAFANASDAPQQHNGYDCGMYVLVVAEFFCRQHVRQLSDAPQLLREFVTPERVTQTRLAMPALVRRLQLEQATALQCMCMYSALRCVLLELRLHPVETATATTTSATSKSRMRSDSLSSWRSVRAFAGDVRATLLLPHQVLVSREDALLLDVDHLEMVHVAAAVATATEMLLLECVVDDWRPATAAPGSVESYVQLSPWTFEALGLLEGSAVAMKRAASANDASAACRLLELSVVRKYPATVRSTSSSSQAEPSQALNTATTTDAALASALSCLPASVRDGKIHLERALERQLRSSGYFTTPLTPGALVPAQLLHETYVFRIEQVDYAPLSAALVRDTQAPRVRVRAWAAPPTELTLASLSVHDERSEAVAARDATLATRLWDAGFAGYDALVHDVLLNVALVVKGASREQSSTQIGSHGILLSGVHGVGKSLACRVLEAEIARAGVRTTRIDGTALAMAAERSRLASTYDFLVHELADAFPDLAVACASAQMQPSRLRCTGVVLLDDVDALFATASGAVADESDSAEPLSPLGSALLRLLDAISDTTQLCVVGTTTSAEAAIPSAAKRSGRFGKTLEVLVPTEAMRCAIVSRHLHALPLAADERASVAATAARLAALTGGYVAKDLVRICRHARVLAHKTRRAVAPLYVTWHDLVTAQQLVKPSQLRELNVASPGALGQTAATEAFAGYAALQQQLVDFITWKFSPTAAMSRLGVANASGILVHGPSGVGKSLLVRTLAARARVNVVSVKSSEVMSKYFGDSEKAVRELFARARAAAPCILFFDEFDAIAHKRAFGDGASGSGDSVYARILSTFLNEMDGVGAASSTPARGEVLVIAATNRVDALDAALVRPGRIDKTIELGFPTVADKAAILAHCTRKMPLDADVDLAALACRATGNRAFTGADLAAVCKDAAFRALRDDVDAASVAMRHFDGAWRHRVGAAHEADATPGESVAVA